MAPTPIWPRATAPSSNNFTDHFGGSSLNARWATLLTGTATATVTDSYVDLNSVAGSQASAIRYATKLDTTKSQLWRVCMSRQAGDGGADIAAMLLTGASAPTPAGYVAMESSMVVQIGWGDQTGGPSLGFSYWDASGTQTFWNNSAPGWGAYNSTRFCPVQDDDYYVVAIQIDAANSRWRVANYCQNFTAAGTWTFQQGWRLFQLTDWVSWSATRSGGSNLWLVIGNPITDDLQTEWRIEWADYAECAAGNVPIYAYAAAKTGQSTGHQIEVLASYDGKTWLPDGRGTRVLTFGSSYDAQDLQEPRCVYDGTTYWLFYTGASSGYASEDICVASASSPTGPFTKSANNPLISPSATGTAQDDVYCSACVVVLDQAEPDSAKRWKMYYQGYSSADNHYRTFYATAAAPDGPWTKRGKVLDLGAAGSNDETNAGIQSVVRYGGKWYLWYEGHDAAGVCHSMLAVAQDLGSPVKTGVATYYDAPGGGDQALTANLTAAPGRTVTVADTSTFDADSMALFSQSTNADTWSCSRIRKVVNGTTLELYHGLTGFTTAYPARVIQPYSSRTWNIRWMGWDGTRWRQYGVWWEPFSASAEKASYGPLYEECHTWTVASAAPDGATPVVDLFSSPVIPRGEWSDGQSVENMSPIDTAYGGDRPPYTRPPALAPILAQ